ncbi:Enoyl-CoA hydratase/carnithine racemase [Natronorubrum sediminis]|uniref:Enoyl-CoA hydratase/carnithine racemase n=1 Tax=Natronorubrum sediminis TaxID=640943 RepID=A0A1H6FLP8_9EURY|nr:enoyl-CoA hydratase/isomerase family protein [Natronorubrum sediminis]SEH11799.1 Enoyl-CoA hydratase/carnithine racemase [Natronorubrum sediminis]
MADYKALNYDHEGDIVTIQFDRPDKLNAINGTMRTELREAAEEAAVSDARVVILKGSGRAFSAGVDHDLLREMGEYESDRFRWEYRRHHRMFDEYEHMEKPVIAAVNGVCAGGGFELALHCDFIVATESATFGYPEDNIGFIPASGACAKLSKEVGSFQAKELVLCTGSKGSMVTAEEAHDRFGFVNRVYDDDSFDSDIQSFAEDLADTAPLATAVGKKILTQSQDMAYVAAREFERTGQSLLAQSQDHEEGMAAFQENRDPEFEGK